MTEDENSTGSAGQKLNKYDMPTPEKRAFGARLKAAREMAGLNQAYAADRLGYAQAVQLSNMEAGNRMPPLDVLIRAAELYGTSMDYLCGFADDPDRDPASAAVRHVSGRVTAEMNRLVNVMVETSIATVRELRPDGPRLLRLAQLALEANSALARLRADPSFDETVRGGATLVARLGLAAELAAEHVAHVARADRVVRGTVAAVAVDAALAPDAELPDLLRQPFDGSDRDPRPARPVLPSGWLPPLRSADTGCTA
jgi:transcriptional regulator with XRE-family HTH domain